MAALPEEDMTPQLLERITEARQTGQRLVICGQQSKHFYAGVARGEPLDIRGHRGVIDYEPGDLVITARSGTPLTELEPILAEQGQCLGFEPPRFTVNGVASGTLGGAVAAGVSGPRRPWAGAARDFVLGVTMVNGRGERLHFGGQLIKNVAGFDVPRLMAGSLGTLGLLLDISIRVVPIRPRELTLSQPLSMEQALAKMTEWQRLPLPISGLVYHQGELSIRLSGTPQGVEAAQRLVGGDERGEATEWWSMLRDQNLPWFQGAEPLWRVSCAAAAKLADSAELKGEWLLDWGGAQRWYRGEAAAAALADYADQIDAQLTCFRGGDRHSPMVLLSPELVGVHRQLKQAFDPDGVFDDQRLQVHCPQAGQGEH
ncbi:MAG: glycolate oxidase subunit GlcE [Gammaproteobacteria bacterium]